MTLLTWAMVREILLLGVAITRICSCAVLRDAEDSNSYTVSAEPLFVSPEELIAVIANPSGTASNQQGPTATSSTTKALLTAPNGTIDQKKQFIGAVLLDSGSKCNRFLNRLTVAQSGVNVTGVVLTTILSGVATAVAPIGVSHGFSAAATIVNGTKTTLNQDFSATASVQDFQKARNIKQQFQKPIAVCLSQSGLETGWGRQVVANAYSGIKAGAGQRSVVTKTHEQRPDGTVFTENDAFRAYMSFDEAAQDYGRFLNTNSRYALAFQHTNDPEAFARAIATADYATSRNYCDMLVNIVRSDNLEAFDRV